MILTPDLNKFPATVAASSILFLLATLFARGLVSSTSGRHASCGGEMGDRSSSRSQADVW